MMVDQTFLTSTAAPRVTGRLPCAILTVTERSTRDRARRRARVRSGAFLTTRPTS